MYKYIDEKIRMVKLPSGIWIRVDHVSAVYEGLVSHRANKVFILLTNKGIINAYTKDEENGSIDDIVELLLGETNYDC